MDVDSNMFLSAEKHGVVVEFVPEHLLIFIINLSKCSGNRISKPSPISSAIVTWIVPDRFGLKLRPLSRKPST